MNDHHTPPLDTPGSSQATVPLPPITPAWSVRPTYQYRAATSLQPLHPPITAAQGLAVGSGLVLALALAVVWWLSRRID